MKKLLFLCSFVLFAGMANAQACKKSGKKCCAKKAEATTSMTQAGNITSDEANLTSALESASMLADQDENVEKRVCAKSGKTSFYQKAVCEKSGKVSWDEVSYCDKSMAFKPVALNSDILPLDAIKEVKPAAAEGGMK